VEAPGQLPSLPPLNPALEKQKSPGARVSVMSMHVARSRLVSQSATSQLD